MVVTDGLTDKLALAKALVPTNAVKAASEYHFQLAPVPNVPPVCVNVELEPLHIGVTDALKLVGATEGVFTVIVTLPTAAIFAVQGAPVALSARK